MNELENLPTERPLPYTAARQALLERHVIAGTRTSRRVPVRMIAFATGTSVLLLGGTAAAYVGFREPTVPVMDQTRCYTEPSTDDSDNFPGKTVRVEALPDHKLTAVEMCSTLWRNGFLVPGANLPVPPLTACVLDSGIAAVFPGDEETCASLGLPHLAE